ncbi:MAG: family transcriptional regulator, cyclic receptor protein [Actinomycetota bacterium]|nr:family transcriptional regulator, cyclic receptor protein [Actinomycetota bacterium]MDQ1617415.1 family transcriptional regulator, cyclic receptor protein [Actinomycetota bacterium]
MEWAILSELSEPDRKRVLAACISRRYSRNDTVFHQGEPGSAFHLLSSGHVAVRVSTSSGDIVTLAVLGPGDFFGEQALLSPRHLRTASVIALEPVHTLSLDLNRFDELRRTNPSVERLLVEVLASQVRRLTTHLVEALYLPAEQRAVRRLLGLVHHYRDGDAPVVIPVTQEDLASLAGTTRPTVNRVLRAMEDAGALRLQRGRIEVLDVQALRRRAVSQDTRTA